MEACTDCTQNCLLIHGKKDPSSNVTSFFKVIYGDSYSEILYLPPKFARTVSALVDQKTQLEDSSGQRWPVTLSDINGSLAFKKGWHKFFSDHNLNMGDILVFNYIMGSHFIVQIYGKHGCLKLDFPEENVSRGKRTRTNRNFIVRNGPCPTVDKVSINEKGSSSSGVSLSDVDICQSQRMTTENTSNVNCGHGNLQGISRTACIEEPFYMINRDAGYIQGEERNGLYDLSDFEMHNGRSGADGSNKVLHGDEISPHHSNTMPKSQDEGTLVDKDPVAVEVAGQVSPSDVADFVISNASAVKTAENRNTPFVCGQNAQQKLIGRSDCCASLVSAPTLEYQSGETVHVVKKELVEMNEVCGHKEILHGNERVLPFHKGDTPFMKSVHTGQQKLTGKSDFGASLVFTAMQKYQSGETVHVVEKELMEMNEASSHKETLHAKESNIIKVKKELVEMNEESGHNETLHGKESNIIKQCGQSYRSALEDNDGIHRVVKTEPADSLNLSSPDTANISCLAVTESQAFLELPTSFPAITFKRTRLDRKVVLLRGRDTRLWPVLYHKRYDLKLLTSGWEAFCKANGIRPGDECVFGIEDETECIFRVDIVHP